MKTCINLSKFFIFFFLIIGSKTIAQVSKHEVPSGTLKAITESNKLYFEAFEKNDSTLFISRYTEDCWIMAPDVPTFCGVDAPIGFYQIAYGQLGIRYGKKTTTSLLGTTNNMVAETGVFEFLDVNKKLIAKGNYLVLWKKTATGWRMFRDSFNGDKEN